MTGKEKSNRFLRGAVPHGLRANAVIRLRVDSYTALQISDMAGMPVEMVGYYSRYADRKAGGQVILGEIREQKDNQIVKHWKNRNQE